MARWNWCQQSGQSDTESDGEGHGNQDLTAVDEKDDPATTLSSIQQQLQEDDPATTLGSIQQQL